MATLYANTINLTVHEHNHTPDAHAKLVLQVYPGLNTQ